MNVHPTTDWKQATPVTTGRVKCGNRRTHGEDVVYHASAQAVRACYSGNQVPGTTVFEAPVVAPVVVPAPAPEPVKPAFERIPVEEIQSWRSIPVGVRDQAFYALRNASGTVEFFRVRRPSTGKYAGKTYVDQQASDFFLDLPFRTAARMLSAIVTDPMAAATLYGKTIKHCAMCHRTLTDDVNKGKDGLTSLERGIGPSCAEKYLGVSR